MVKADVPKRYDLHTKFTHGVPITKRDRYFVSKKFKV